nr:MAG TPA: hypothetical protein [Caudoviricetes sp.]
MTYVTKSDTIKLSRKPKGQALKFQKGKNNEIFNQ